MTAPTPAPDDGLVERLDGMLACIARTQDQGLGRCAELMAAARQRITALEGVLGDIFDHFQNDGTGRDDDAPGHCHDRPGVWDDDNEPSIAGEPCDWCAKWSRARAALAQPGEADTAILGKENRPC